MVVGIATQGRADQAQWVKSYRITYRQEAQVVWTFMTDADGVAMVGNTTMIAGNGNN